MNVDRQFVYDMQNAASKYEHEVEKFGTNGGMPRQSTIRAANEAALEGTVALANAQVYAEVRQETLDYYSMLNERYDVDHGDRPTDEEMEQQRDSVEKALSQDQQNEHDFYEAVYRVDPILTDYTRDNLGQPYEDFVNQKRFEEQEARDHELEAQRAEARSMGGAQSTFINKETGESYQSLTQPDEYGNPREDEYGFDEFN